MSPVFRLKWDDKTTMKFLVTVASTLLLVQIGAAQWTPDPDCPYPQTTVYRFPYPGDCNKYWECFGGSKYVQQCPPGLEFNAPKMQCDTPELAHCNETTTVAPNGTTGPTTEPPRPTKWTPDPLCPYPSDEAIYYDYPGNCSKYYECFNGTKYVRICPRGLYWNEAISECDYPSNVDCNNSTRPTARPRPTTTPIPTTSGRTTTWKPDPLCPYPSTDVVYFHYPGDCTKYYECFAGHKFTRQCPSNLWWHQSIQECDYPANVDDCKPGTTNPPKPTPTPSVVCPFPSNETSYSPYPGDCQKYYECYEGRPYVLVCPKDLYWNQKKLSCDYWEQVEC